MRRITPTRTLAVVLALGLVLAACGGGKKKPPPTTTTAPPTTVAPAPEPQGMIPPGGGPLTGTPVDPAKASRPLLIVKIDNAPKARPQTGLNQADVVVEEAVEGGVTRFVAMYHSQDTDVGPVRSARSTDMLIAGPLNRPLFAYSGANAAFDQLIKTSPVVNVGYNAFPRDYTRVKGRPALYDVFSHTSRMFAHAPEGAGPPPPLLAFRFPGQEATGEPAAGVKMEYRGRIVTAVQWAWDAGAGAWKRSQDGGPHMDSANVQVSADNVVVQIVTYHDTPYVDQSGARVPEADLIGEGDVWVLSEGKVMKGRWKRTGPNEVTQYLDAAGAPLRLKPGRTWIELPIPGNATLG
jgi:hypothetical protein